MKLIAVIIVLLMLSFYSHKKISEHIAEQQILEQDLLEICKLKYLHESQRAIAGILCLQEQFNK